MTTPPTPQLAASPYRSSTVVTGALLASCSERVFFFFKTAIHVFECGVAVEKGSSRTFVRWDDLSEFQHGQTSVRVHGINTGVTIDLVSVTLPDGTRATVQGRFSGDVPAVKAHIVQRFVPTMVSRCVEAVERGEPVAFGKIRIENGDLLKGSKSVALNALGPHAIGQGYLAITRATEEKPVFVFDVRLGTVPNVEGLLEILRRAGSRLITQSR